MVNNLITGIDTKCNTSVSVAKIAWAHQCAIYAQVAMISAYHILKNYGAYFYQFY